MSKDPAVLFYTSDFISGTLTMTDAQRGKYIMLLCLQHQQGLLSEEDMLNICKTYDDKIFRKFIKTPEGFYYNQRMKNESERRKKYSESRSKNRKNICESYDKHMETETINKNYKRCRPKKFVPPTLDEVKAFFQEKGYSEIGAIKAFNHYNLASWHDTEGKPVLSWKQKMNTNWLKDEYKIKGSENSFVPQYKPVTDDSI